MPRKSADSSVPSVWRLKITLTGSQPAIWRRIEVPSHIDLGALHRVLQIAMGWEDSHLHQFLIGERAFGPIPDPEDDIDTEFEDETSFTLGELGRRRKLVYEYDFGDGWEHEIVVEGKRAAHEGEDLRPSCLDGERACPPEDCGGIPGYERLLEILAAPDHPEHEQMLFWLGEQPFDPEAFAPAGVNRQLRPVRRPRSPRLH